MFNPAEFDAGPDRNIDEDHAIGVVVLGSGRSGTSAMMRGLTAAGFFAGESAELYGAESSNPRGHFEFLPALAIDEEALRHFGCHWWAGAPSDEVQLDARDRFVPRIDACLNALAEAAGARPIALKEPRINALLPLWDPVIRGRLHPILVIRNPLEIAFSQHHRDGTPLPHALASWEYVTGTVLRWLDGQTMTVAPYPAIASEAELSESCIEQAVSQLAPGLRSGVEPGEAAKALEPELRNQDARELDLRDYLTDRQLALWSYLEDLPAGNAVITVPGQLREPSTAAREVMEAENERLRVIAAYASATKQVEASEKRSFEVHDALNELTAAAADQERRLTREIAGMRAEICGLRRDLAEKTEAILSLHKKLSAVLDSTSWRVTAPARRLAGTIRRRDSPD